MSSAATRVEWHDFISDWKWKQGEHVTFIGTTNSGKTTLARQLLKKRGYVIILASKKKDSSISKYLKDGYVLQEKFMPEVADRIVYKPKIKHIGDVADVHRESFKKILDYVFQAGNWCVNVDELRYICHILGLSREMTVLWTQGRSLGISIMGGTQRPRFVPLEAYSQPTHLFFWKDNDDENIKRVSSLTGLDKKVVFEEVCMLGSHETLYFNTRTNERLITKVSKEFV